MLKKIIPALLASLALAGGLVLLGTQAWSGQTETKTKTPAKAKAKAKAKAPAKRAPALAAGMKQCAFKVEGMTCGGCVNRITGTMTKVKGIAKVKVSLEKKRAEIQYNPKTITTKKLGTMFKNMGYKATLLAQAPKAKKPAKR